MSQRKTPRKINNRLRIVTTLSQFGIDSAMLVEDNDILEKITTPSGESVCSVHRGFSFFLSTVEVRDTQNEVIGSFKQHLFSVGGAFTVLSASGKELCHLKGSWTGWNFRFVADDGTEFAHVTKKWSGVGKELFTSADNYVLEIDESVPTDNPLRQIIFSAVMCIDMVLKE